MSFWRSWFRKNHTTKTDDPKTKSLSNAKGSRETRVIAASQYREFLKELAKSVGSHWPDDLYARHDVYCEKCGVAWNRDVLNMLLALGPGSISEGAQVIIPDATEPGDRIRSGACFRCNHRKIRIVLKNPSHGAEIYSKTNQLHCDLCNRAYPPSLCHDISVKESGAVVFTCPTCQVTRVQFKAQ